MAFRFQRLEKYVQAMYVHGTRYNVTECTLVGLVTMYCMDSKSEHMLSIGNSFDVHCNYIASALCGQHLRILLLHQLLVISSSLKVT